MMYRVGQWLAGKPGIHVFNLQTDHVAKSRAMFKAATSNTKFWEDPFYNDMPREDRYFIRCIYVFYTNQEGAP